MLNHNLTHDDVLVSYGRYWYSESICVKYKNKCNEYPFRFDRRRSGNVLCERTVTVQQSGQPQSKPVPYRFQYNIIYILYFIITYILIYIYCINLDFFLQQQKTTMTKAFMYCRANSKGNVPGACVLSKN